jgi:hypothetical protein
MTTQAVPADPYHPWTTYMWASEEARRRGDRRAGAEHLLLGLLEDPAIESVLGVSRQDARHTLDALDREALGALGIDPEVDAPPLRMHPIPKRPTVKTVITDRLRMTPAAKTVLREAAKPMRRGKHMTARQVLPRLLELEPPDPAAVLLTALGVNARDVLNTLNGSTPGP